MDGVKQQKYNVGCVSVNNGRAAHGDHRKGGCVARQVASYVVNVVNSKDPFLRTGLHKPRFAVSI